jgi:LysR family nitrogen assimilation transcriptional regulator
MDFKQLRYFARIAEAGNMTRASESLRIAQPALTQQIANLEADLGVRVFDRGRHGVTLTSAGDVLYGYAISVLKQLEDARVAVRDETEHPSGRVVVGISGSAGKVLAVPLVRALAGYDRIVLEIVERPSAELLALVAGGRLDVAIVVDAPARRGASITPLLMEDLYVILPRGTAGTKASVSLAEVAAQPLILPSPPSTIRQRVDTAFMDARLPYRLVAEVSTTDMLVRVVRAGLGWTILPWAAVGDEVNRRLVDTRPIRRRRLRRELSLCVSATVPLSRASEVVRASLLAILDEAVTSGAWTGVERVARDDDDRP